MSKVNKSKRGRGNNKSGNRRKNKDGDNNSYRRVTTGNAVMETSDDIIRHEIVKWLKYVVISSPLKSNTTDYAAFSLRCNSCFDPEVALGGGQPEGFPFYANFYAIYRVLSAYFRCVISNYETFPVFCGIVMSANNLGASIASIGDAMNALEGANTTRAQVVSSKTGKDATVLTGGLPLWRIYGNKRLYEETQEYGALVSANPAVTMYMTLIIYNDRGQNLTNGVSYNWVLEQKVRFNDRQNTLVSFFEHVQNKSKDEVLRDKVEAEKLEQTKKNECPPDISISGANPEFTQDMIKLYNLMRWNFFGNAEAGVSLDSRPKNIVRSMSNEV